MGFWRAEKDRYVPVGIAATLVLATDQISKWLIMKYLPPGGVVTVIPDFFDLVNIRNRGAAFGFLNRQDIEWQFWLFLIAAILAVIIIFKLLKGARRQPLLAWGLGLILGGALGNMADRARFRAVVDFLDFHWRQWHWPAFNVADIAICVGAFLACLSVWLKKPGEDA